MGNSSWWTLLCPFSWAWCLCLGCMGGAMFSWAPWWTLFFCAPWGSLLCPWGSPWAAGGHWGCLSAGCLALYCWGWISLVVQVLLIMSPSPCLQADFLSEMKLKASFSAMSQFAVLALTQSSKVLKEIDLLFVSSMVLKEILLVPLLSMVLKEGALLTSCSMSWKETFFLPDLPMVLKEVSLPLFLTVSLTLLALSFLWWLLCHLHQGSWRRTCVCIALSCLTGVSLAGVLKGVSVHVHM